MSFPPTAHSRVSNRHTAAPVAGQWTVCSGAASGATVSQLPHGALIRATCFTSLAPQCQRRLAGSEKLQYEVHLLTAGLLQIGWCALVTENAFNENEGVGDLPLSVAVDGCRGMMWHVDGTAVPSLRWGPGDVVGCYADLSTGEMNFALNGVQMATIKLPTNDVFKTHAAQPASSSSSGSYTRRQTGTRDATLIYVPALSLGASEACVVNTGETSLRYPRQGYHTLCEYDEFYLYRARAADAVNPSKTPALAPVPLGMANVCDLVVKLGTSKDQLCVPESLSQSEAVQVETIAACATNALASLANVIHGTHDDPFDSVMVLVQWLQEDVNQRWNAFVLTLYLWLSRLYVGDDDSSEPNRRVVALTDLVRQRIQKVFECLEMLMPLEHFRKVPSILLAVFQHRLADRSGARKVAYRVARDLVELRNFRRFWVQDGALFHSTLLNLFQIFQISASESRWLAQQLDKNTLEQVLLASADTPSPLSRNQLEFHARAVQCVETLFADTTCHAALTVALSSLAKDTTLVRDDISCTLEARLGGYRPNLPLTFAMPSPAAVVGLLSWAVAAAIGKLMEAGTGKIAAVPREPYSLYGLEFRQLALQWLPPRTFYGSPAEPVAPSSPTTRATAPQEKPDLRVGGSFTSLQALLQAESSKTLSQASSPTSIPSVSRTTTASCLATSRHQSTMHDDDDAGAWDSDGEAEEAIDESDDDEGPALGSATIGRRTAVSMSTVRRQRNDSTRPHPPPTQPRWDEQVWRRQSRQFTVDRAEHVQAVSTDARANNHSSTLGSPLAAATPMDVVSPLSSASASRTRRTAGSAAEDACRVDLYRTAMGFIHTFTRHPTALLGSLELLYNLAEQYRVVSAGNDTRYSPVAPPSSDKSTPREDSSGHTSLIQSLTEPPTAHELPASSPDEQGARTAAGVGGGAFAHGQTSDDALRELGTMLRRVDMSRHWGQTMEHLGRFVLGTWMVMAYYWSRMNLFERHLLLVESASSTSSSTSAAVWMARDREESTECPPRAFLMLPIEMVELCAEMPVYSSVLDTTGRTNVQHLSSVLLLTWDAQLRRAVSHATVRTLLYRATASLFGSNAKTRQTLTQSLQQQKQAHEAYLEHMDPSQLDIEDPFSLYEATFLDGLDAYTSQENFNEASTLNLLFSLSQESCLLPPPKLFEENFWWVNELRRGGDDHKASTTHDQRASSEADALNLHAAVSAVLKTDVMDASILGCISKCNQLLTQFSELLPIAPGSERHTEEVKKFHLKYVLLRKSLYVLDFLVKVFATSVTSAPRRTQTSLTRRQQLDSIRVSLMDLLTQCVVRLGFHAQGDASATPACSANRYLSNASRGSMVSYWSTTTNALTESVAPSSTYVMSTPASSVATTTLSGNVLQAGFYRDVDGWWSCMSSPCTVTGLLAPVFSMLSYIINEGGSDTQANPYFRVSANNEVLVRRSLELLNHPAWWTPLSPTPFPWRKMDEAIPERSQGTLRSLQTRLREMEMKVRCTHVGSATKPALSPTRSSKAIANTAGMGARTEGEEMCLICQEVPSDTRFAPCGHTCCHLCLSRYQNTLTVKAASSARRSAPSSRSRETGSSTPGEASHAVAADDEFLTMSVFSSSRRSRDETPVPPEKCFFCQQLIQGVESLT